MSCGTGYINILDDFLNPDGTSWTGSITYTLIYTTSVAGATLINARQNINVYDGIDLCVVPGVYNVVYNQSGQNFPVSGQWTVPSAGGPYTVAEVSGSSTIADPEPNADPATSTVVSDGLYNAFPGITVTADGTLVAVYKRGTLHIGGNAQVVSQRGTRNADGSITWATAVVIDNDQTYTTQGASIMTLTNGNLLATCWLYNLAGATSIGPGYAFISTNGGVSWGSRITVGGCTGYVNISGKAIQLSSGRVLLPVFGQDQPSGLLAARCQYSDDNGATWATLSTMLTGNNAIEVSIVQCTDTGNIVATYRNQGSNLIGRNVSTDNGATWSAYADKFSGASPAPMIYTTAGAILTGYRSWTEPTRSQCGLRVTYDEGVTWTTPEWTITSASNTEFEYCDFVQLTDGIGFIWAAQSSTSESTVRFTKLPNNFGPVPITQTAQGFTAQNGPLVMNGGNIFSSSRDFVFSMPGVTDALGTGSISFYPHGVSGAWGAGIGAHAAAHATYPGVSFAGTSAGGWFGVYDTAGPTGNRIFGVLATGHAVLGLGAANPLGLVRELTVRSNNSSNQVGLNLMGYVIVDGSSPAQIAIWNNAVRTLYMVADRSGADNSADFSLFLATTGSLNCRLKVDKAGNVGLGGSTVNKQGLAKEATIESTTPGTQVGLNLSGYASSGTNTPGSLTWWNNSVRTAFIIAPRSGADNSADMEFYTSVAGSLSQALSLGKAGPATFRDVLLCPLTTPASSAATGTAGTIEWDANYIYVCTSANTWKRATLAAF